MSKNKQINSRNCIYKTIKTKVSQVKVRDLKKLRVLLEGHGKQSLLSSDINEPVASADLKWEA